MAAWSRVSRLADELAREIESLLTTGGEDHATATVQHLRQFAALAGTRQSRENEAESAARRIDTRRESEDRALCSGDSEDAPTGKEVPKPALGSLVQEFKSKFQQTATHAQELAGTEPCTEPAESAPKNLVGYRNVIQRNKWSINEVMKREMTAPHRTKCAVVIDNYKMGTTHALLAAGVAPSQVHTVGKELDGAKSEAECKRCDQKLRDGCEAAGVTCWNMHSSEALQGLLAKIGEGAASMIFLDYCGTYRKMPREDLRLAGRLLDPEHGKVFVTLNERCKKMNGVRMVREVVDACIARDACAAGMSLIHRVSYTDTCTMAVYCLAKNGDTPTALAQFATIAEAAGAAAPSLRGARRAPTKWVEPEPGSYFYATVLSSRVSRTRKRPARLIDTDNKRARPGEAGKFGRRARVLATESPGDDPWPAIVQQYDPATGTYTIAWCGYGYTTKGIPGEQVVARPATCPYPDDDAYMRAWCNRRVE